MISAPMMIDDVRCAKMISISHPLSLDEEGGREGGREALFVCPFSLFFFC